jgi:hypothetical protein
MVVRFLGGGIGYKATKRREDHGEEDHQIVDDELGLPAEYEDSEEEWIEEEYNYGYYNESFSDEDEDEDDKWDSNDGIVGEDGEDGEVDLGFAAL